MSATIVSGGLIYKDNKILITQRKKGANEGLKWEFPGGKLEENETPQQCLEREINEELGISISVGDIFDVVYHKYPSITILLLFYSCKYTSGDIKAIDCNDFKWVELSELAKYDFAAADISIVKRLVNNK